MLPPISVVVQGAGLRANFEKDSYNLNCPFCGDDKRKHLNVSNKKDVFRCPRCGQKGGIAELYALLHQVSKEQALAELTRQAKEGMWNIRPETAKGTADCHRPPEELNKVYTALLEELSLFSKHEQQLLQRGLNPMEIDWLGFKSTTGGFDRRLAERLLERGLTLRGTPGFARKNGIWMFTPLYGGLLIPYRNQAGQITGMQLRTYLQRPKYVWLSSSAMRAEEGFSGGAKALAAPHLIGFSGQKAVCLTEGGLKGDIAHCLCKRLYGKSAAFLCIAGVNNKTGLADALDGLKQAGVKKIYNCLDMDRNIASRNAFNPHVFKASLELMSWIREQGFQMEEKVWCARYKGIDDYLAAEMEKRKLSLPTSTYAA